MKYLLYLCLLIASMPAFAQEHASEAASPLIRQYLPKEYKAHGQNFAIIQNRKGVLYFANFSGVLEYDGVFWNTIPTANISKVSALFLNKSDQIMVGANDEFGLLATDSTGTLRFRSLSKGQAGFGPIQSIFETADGTYFIARSKIFLWNGKSLKSWKSAGMISSAYLIGNSIYAFKRDVGLLKFNNGSFSPVAVVPGSEKPLDANSLFATGDKIFLITSRQGIYQMEGNSLRTFDSPANRFLKDKELFGGASLDDRTLGLFTSEGDFVKIDANTGAISGLISKAEMLQGERINDWMIGRNGSLWMALDNGIGQMQISSPISEYGEQEGLRGQVNDILRFGGRLYAATSSGLFMLQEGRFSPIPGIRVAAWSLAAAGNILYAASSSGLYRISEGKAGQVTDRFTLSVLAPKADPSRLYLGLETGVAVLDMPAGSRKLLQMDAQISKIVEAPNGDLWCQSQSRGVFRLNRQTLQVTGYGSAKGLPTLLMNRVFAGSFGILVSNSKGVFQYDPKADQFKPFSAIRPETGTTALWKGLLIEDEKGNIWTTHGDDQFITRYERNGATGYTAVTVPFLPLAEKTVYDIFPDRDNITWFGGPEGLIRFDQNQKQSYREPYMAFLRKIALNADSLIFNGFIDSRDSIRSRNKIPYKFNNISFEFSAASMIPDDHLEFQYKLENFDKTESAWTSQTQKEYTNLPPGNYRFVVRAKNVYDNESSAAAYSFTVLAPLYTRWWAILLYLLAAVGIVWIIVKKRLEFIARRTKALEELIKERTEEVVNQKEELEQQSDALSATNDQLERIDDFVKSINSEVNTVKLFQMSLDRLCDFQNVDSASGLVYNKAKNAYQFIALSGRIDIASVADVEMTYEQIAQRYIDNANEVFEDIFVKNDFQYENLNNSIDEMFAPKSLISIGIRVEGQVKSIITLENTEQAFAFTQRDFNMVRNLKEHLIGAYIKTNILEDLESTLSNLKAAQEELIRQERLASVGSLTKGIVDRILNPLNYINNFSQSSGKLLKEITEVTDKHQEGLSEDEKDDLDSGFDMLKRNLEKIYEHGNSTTRIVKDMQKLLKGKSTEFLVTELNPFLESKARSAIQEVLNEYKDAQVKLTFSLNSSAVRVSLLPYEFAQVLTNLISNACYAVIEKTKYDKNFDPEIKITTRLTDGWVSIVLRDNGKGIPPKETEQLFNPFFTTKPTSKGTGLGLYMSKDIIEYHKGRLSANSKEGEFTEMEIVLPIVK